MLMRLLALCLLCTAATAVGAQMPMPQEKQEPLQFLSVDEVKKQIEEARGLPGPRVPTAEERKQPVAEVVGTTVTVGELLAEVTSRFAGALEMPLLNQAVMRMESIRRGATITEEEFVKGVRMYLAQKKSIQTKRRLRELIPEAQLSWDTFERMIRDQVKIQKVVRADLKIPQKSDQAFNPLLMQIWAGQQLRGKYMMEMDVAKLPAGVLGAVTGSRPVGDVMADVAKGGVTVTLTDKNELQLIPKDGGWPRYKAPNVEVDRIEPDGKRTKVAVVDVARWIADPTHPAAEKKVTRTIRVSVDGGAPVVLPPITIRRMNDAGGMRATAPLSEMLDAVSKQAFVLQDDGTYRKEKGAFPAYALPEDAPAGASDLVKSACGKPVAIAGLAQIGSRFELPDVPVTMYCHVDRHYILSFSYGKLRPIHYELALKSLAQYRSVKQKFKDLGIAVDEAKVKAAIDAENQRFSHPLFNRKMILQAKGTTPFDEDRKIWVANGVDQIIGSELKEEDLRKYYQANILHFGKAKMRAAHILIEAADPDTGKEDWAAAERRINEVATAIYGQPDPRRAFGEMAQRYSMDKATARKGGDLGEFELRGQMSKAFASAAFALKPGEISAPVKTGFGYHLIMCLQRTPPDLEKNSFENPDVRAQVELEFQQDRRKQWLEKNVYADMKVKRLAKKLFGS